MNRATEENEELAGERPPALGERAALTGYVAQYLIAASLLLRSLTEETLDWVAVVDPEAGRLDDFQLATPGQLDAYQVKWSSAGGQLSWAPLRGYLSDLIKDRRRLAEQNPDRRTVGHLYTDQVASSSPIAGVQGCRPGASPAAAMAEVFRPLASSGEPRTIAPEWQPIWNDLAAASGLSGEELLAEFANVRIELGRSLPSETELPGQDAPAYRRDLDELVMALLRVTTDPRRLVRLSRDELLTRLGDRWVRRLELAATHEFPAPLLYEPIGATAAELGAAIDRFTTGYVALIGSPGSGKSTLLTQELSGRDEVVARYYAYVRGRADIGARRAEASSFLHDLVLTLERGGLPRGPTPVDYDVVLLAPRLLRQLAELGERFASEGARSIVIVDGLDHVEREGDLEQPLLRYLPRPEDLPDGVLFVVGGQSVGMLRPEIRGQLAQPDRTVQMAGLDRPAVDRITRGMGVTVGVDELWRVTEGHPLLVTYVVEELKDIPAIEQTSHLATLPAYGGDVGAVYDRLWTDVEDDPAVVELLGLISRLRGSIDFDWLRDRGESPEVVRKLRDRAAYLFRREPERWYFFHESFRLYLLDRTSRAAGEPSASEDQRFHRRLAQLCQATPPEHPLSWESLFHLSGAGEHGALLALATPDFFRRQQLLLRPPELVSDDLRMAARSLALIQDPMALVRLAIAAGEVNQRSVHAPTRESFLRLLVLTGDGQIAIEHMASERESLGEEDDRTARLQISLHLLDVGLIEEAREVFLSNEPLEMLTGHSARRHARGPYQLLYAWASAAAVFRGPNTIISSARNLSLPPDRDGSPDDDQDPSPAARAWMCAAAADELYGRDQADAAGRLAAELDPSEDIQRGPWLWLAARRWRRQPDLMAEILGDVLARLQPFDVEPEQRLAVAEALWWLGNREESLAWIADLRQPSLSSEPGQVGNTWEAEQFRYRLNRLLAANGSRTAPDELVPRPQRDFDWGYVHAARITLAVAQLDGRVWAGESVDANDVLRALGNVLQTLHVGSTGEWSTRHTVAGMRAPALARLMTVATAAGREATLALWSRYKERWQAEAALLLTEGHQVLLAAARSGFLGPADLQAHCRDLENQVQESLAGGEAPTELIDLAETMLELGLPDDARRLIRQAVASTLSVHYRKDYQVSSWIDLLGPRLDGPDGAELARWLAGSIAGMRESTEGGQAADAARQLLLADGAIRPQHSWSLGRWLEDHQMVDWDDRAMALLEARLADAREKLWWNVLVDQVASISPQPNVALLRRGVAEVGLSPDLLRPFLLQLLARVAVVSPPRTREQWRTAVADCAAAATVALADLGLPNELHPDRHAPRSRSRGTDEDQRDAFLAAHTDVSSLLEAAASADLSEWRSGWEEAVALNLGQMTLADVDRAAGIFAAGSHRLGIRVLLAQRALALEAPDVAARLADQVLESAEARSWLRNWDRAPIMGAFRILLAIDPARARDRAYRRFAADAGSDVYLLSEVGRELVEFLDVFGITDEEALGGEVEAYLRVLLPAPEAQPGPELHVEADDAKAALATVGFELLSSPYRLAVTTAQRALAGAVIEADEYVQRLLVSTLEGDDEEQVLRVLSVLEAAVVQGATLAADVGPPVDRWRVADHLGLRLAAQRLGERIGLPPRSAPGRDLPTSFTIVVPQGREPGGAERAEPLGRDDLERTLTAFTRELRPLAEAGGVDLGALNARVAHIARQRAGSEPIDDDRWQTNNSPLGWSFHKPSIRLWEQAAARVAAELVDAGHLDTESALELSVGPGYDPDLIAAGPTAQPDEVSGLPGRDEMWIRPEEWVAGVETAADRLTRTLSGEWIVLGERSELRRIDQEMPWERRVQSLGVTGAGAPGWFEGLRRTLVSELNAMAPPRDEDPLVHSWDPSFRGPTIWLSLHPRLAAACGWMRDPDVLIGWRDEEGPVVRSIWWRSGWLDATRWGDHDEVGEGWLVVVQPQALERMAAEMRGSLQIAWQVERGFLGRGLPDVGQSGVRPPG
ncbi:MAG: hypothetical protein WD096_09490 [Actinomycetota bacterium]